MDKKLLIIANWKSNKTASEALSWLNTFSKNIQDLDITNKEIIICPSFTSLLSCFVNKQGNNLPIHIGAQNVSRFEEGAYTGEVSARQIKEFAEYVIINHSERRQNFSENDQDIEQKVNLCQKNGLKTIVCVQNANSYIPQNADIVAYEPVFAIGTGNPDTPENVQNVLAEISKNTGKNIFLYGGSVDETNIKEFVKISLLSGLLIGSQSLDPNVFSNLLSKC